VEMILLVDSWITPLSMWYRAKTLSWAGARRALARRVERLRLMALPASRSRIALESASEQSNRPISELPFDVRERVYKKARRSYQLLPLKSSAVLLRSQDDRLDHLLAKDRSVGWSGLFAGGLEIAETPGDHVSLLQYPHIQVLAQRINECIAKCPYQSERRIDALNRLTSKSSRR
jgi:thioesterase domain-containing protein